MKQLNEDEMDAESEGMNHENPVSGMWAQPGPDLVYWLKINQAGLRFGRTLKPFPFLCLYPSGFPASGSLTQASR